jgi:threonine aldolase
MANQIALRILSEPGDELLADAWSHLFINELGGPAVHSGLVMRALESTDGRFSSEQVREAVWDRRDTHRPTTRLVSIENTNNSAGGRIWPVDEIAAMADVCRELDLRLQLDGARLLNASVGSGVPADEIGRHFDAVTLCLSKGLGCPLGALVAGSEERMVRARRLKHLFGGAMRQAGIVAAAGVYALDHHVALLADDHARARRLAEGWQAAGLPVDLDQVETNFVQLDVESLGLSKWEVISALKEAGVGVSNTVHPTRLRALTHLDVTDEDIDAAIELAPEALAARV